ncbi:glutamate--tRNA ligase [Clostridium sp.]|uniref:glutamate--tRNA ligase n=1 Tax=Clostridium sp. TaxID=1506 RepID=UPI002FC5F2CC
MNNNKIIADLLLPDVNSEANNIENIYVERNLPKDAIITRFAPSPTGFLHLGSLYAAMIPEKLAHQSNGIFYLRVEDTDTKREVENAIVDTINALKIYNISFDEGMINNVDSKGSYGPYKQSERANIYKTYVKALIERGLAYPCFCSHDELNLIRKNQENLKINTGYYGHWAKCRDISLKDIKENLDLGKSYVIRLKSPGSSENKISFKDLIKGNIEIPENDQDIVILKSDGLPTYHFAHAIDDHLMKTTHVIRGEEWLSSTPIHLQLFKVLGFALPQYAHISTIMKMDGNSKRKLSKRKDPEISFNYYQELGYPKASILEYLLTLVNSNFEQWRLDNPTTDINEFKISIDKMSASSPLFDKNKLDDISKNVIASIKANEICELYLAWAKNYDKEFWKLISLDTNYLVSIFNIDRDVPKPRKDIAKWSDVKELIGYFYDDVFNNINSDLTLYPKNISIDDINIISNEYINVFDPLDDMDTWFNKIKIMCDTLGFAKDMKSFKKNPELFKGHVGDVTMVLRVILTKKTNTPNLYDVMRILGKEKVVKRLSYFKNS